MKKLKYACSLGSENKRTKEKCFKAFPSQVGLALLVSILCCCTPTLMPPPETDVPSAQKHLQGITLAQLTEGYVLYTSKCVSCHSLYRPDKFSDEKWRHEIKVMGVKAKLDPPQVESITRYILTAKETGSFRGKK